MSKNEMPRIFIRREILSILVNFIFRAASLSGKFLLIIFMAKEFSPDAIGVYGLFSASIVYVLYLAGLDFYTYANRELMALPAEVWPIIIRDQSLFYFFSYLLIIPLTTILIFGTKILSWKYCGWFYPILIIEHFAQESGRILICLQRPLSYGFILFLRSGLWPFAVLGVMFFFPNTKNLNTVWMGWCFSGLICACFSCWFLRGLDWRALKRKKPDLKWIKKGITICTPLFIATIAIKGIFTFDRYFLKFYYDESAVGVYVFFVSIANVVQLFMDSTVIVTYYPKIVTSYLANDLSSYSSNRKQMAKAIIIGIISLSAASSVLIFPLLEYVGKIEYLENLPLFWILIGSNILFVFSYIPHFPLYAMRKDRVIMVGSLLALFLCILLFNVLAPPLNAVGIALSLLLSSLFLLVFKTAYLFKHGKLDGKPAGNEFSGKPSGFRKTASKQ